LDVSITFRFTEQEAQNLALYAWRYQLSMADVVRDALSLLSVTGI
jgi:hypothetical protein